MTHEGKLDFILRALPDKSRWVSQTYDEIGEIGKPIGLNAAETHELLETLSHHKFINYNHSDGMSRSIPPFINSIGKNFLKSTNGFEESKKKESKLYNATIQTDVKTKTILGWTIFIGILTLLIFLMTINGIYCNSGKSEGLKPHNNNKCNINH